MVRLASLSEVCRAHYTLVESPASRAPLSQSPAIDESQSSLDAVVEGNLHGTSGRISSTKQRQGSLPSSTSGFKFTIEPPVFLISYFLLAYIEFH